MADPLYSQVVHPETQPTAYENMQKKITSVLNMS